MPARKPIEQKRVTARSATKDSAGRPIPHPDNVRSLPGCGSSLPDAPEQLGPKGRARWEWLWRNAAWLSPATDIAILVRLCEAEDLRVGMRAALADMGFWVEGSMGQMRPNPLIDKLRLLDDQITRYETACGLTPAARGALGVGEVKAEKSSPLDAILQQAATRRQA